MKTRSPILHALIGLTMVLGQLLSANAQDCNYPPRIFQTLYSDLLLDNGATFGAYGVPDEVNRVIWLPHCQGVAQEADFRIEALGFKKPWFSKEYDTEYYYELVRTPYNCATGALGSPTVVHTSAIATSDQEFISISFTAEVTELAQYRVKFYSHGRNLLGKWPKAWGEEWTNTITFGEAQAEVAPAASLNAVGTVDVTTLPYGTVTIDTVCGSSVILLDGSSSSCENAYAVTVHRLDVLNWVTGEWLGETGWVTGEAPSNINLSALVPSHEWQHGDHYLATFIAGPGWNPVYLPFTFADVEVVGSLQGHHSTYWKNVHVHAVADSPLASSGSGIGAAMYQVHRVCSDRKLWLDSTDSRCAENWGIRIIELNAADFSETGTEWIKPYHHSNFLKVNLSDLYGAFASGKVYKITLFANSPYTYRHFYVELVPCVDGNPRSHDDTFEFRPPTPLPNATQGELKPSKSLAQPHNQAPVEAVSFNLVHKPGEGRELSLNGLPEQGFEIEFSVDLQHWEKIDRNSHNIDTKTHRIGFYRAVLRK